MLKLGKVEIRGPVVIASGPVTRKLAFLQQAEHAGASGASLKLTFIKAPFKAELRAYSVPDEVLISPTDKRFDLEEGLALAVEAKKKTSLTIFANLGAAGSRIDEWCELARRFEVAGVDALELNYCCPNLETGGTSPELSTRGAQIGQNPEQCQTITRAVCEETEIPIICKLLPNAPNVTEVIKACENGGADAFHIVGMPASGLPPVDIETDGRPLIGLTDGVSTGSSNGAICRYSTYMSIAQIAQVSDLPIIASGGLSTWQDAINAIMWGASAVSVCSALMWHGFDVVRDINEGIEDFVRARGAASWLDFRGQSLKHLTTPDKMVLQDGAAEIDAETCIACKKCLQPAHCDAITMVEEKAKVIPEHCIRCGICVSLCPVDAIHLR